MGSKNTLMIIAVVAVAFALFNLIVTINKVGSLNSITGYDISSSEGGETNLSISTNIQINFTESIVQWGAGAVTASSAELDSETEVATDGTWAYTSGTGYGLLLENLGNVDVDLDLQSNVDAPPFIGGGAGIVPDPEFQWKFDNTVLGCDSAATTPLNPTSYADVTCVGGLCNVDAVTPLNVCSNFTSTLGSSDNQLRIYTRIVIPSDAVGVKSALLTATAAVPAV